MPESEPTAHTRQERQQEKQQETQEEKQKETQQTLPSIYSKEQYPNPLQVLGESVTVFDAHDSAKPFEVHLQEGQPNGGPPPHHHPWDEAFYVLEGEVSVTIDGRECRLGAGGFAHIPGGTVHSYSNLSSPTRLLAVVSGCRGGEVFQQMDQQVKQLPRDLEALTRINEQFGVVFV